LSSFPSPGSPHCSCLEAMCAVLIATLRRLPGGAYVKVPRSQAMPAVPVQTTTHNLSTYFTTWPKHKSQFLIYGTRRAQHTLPGLSNNAKEKLPTTADGTRVGQDADEIALYGPDLGGAATSGEIHAGEAMPSAAGGAKRQVDKGPTSGSAVSARPLGLAGVMRRFHKGEKLTMVTAYDFPSGRFARGAGVELVLVGDSLGNCRLGLPDTVGVTMEDMIRATTAVRRGIDAPPPAAFSAPPGTKPVLVGDMPFGSYLIQDDALRNAAAFRVAGADMVKLEGGRQLVPFVRALTSAGIAVMSHIGLEPQKALLQGGLKLQGTTAKAALELLRDARELAKAGAVALVVECVPVEVGLAVQAAVPNIPVIGIGSGGEVAGQVLVCDDLLGLHGSPPSFVKMYADIGKSSAAAYMSYLSEVRNGAFPGTKYARRMQATEVAEFRRLLPQEGLSSDTLAEPDTAISASVPGSRGVTATPTVFRPRTTPELHKSRPGALELIGGAFLHLRKSQGGSATSLRAMSQVASEEPTPEVFCTREQVHKWRRSRRSVALVPTMGNLHEGHLELIDEAKRHADDVLVSIFVNPAQFAAHEDLDTYPRTLARDLELLKARGASAVFTPKPVEMYPHGSPGGTVVVPKFVKGKSEDACRPHFFTGVATVCLKLFNLCDPDVVVFGQKDAMQCAVISHMLEDLLLDQRVSLIVAPTSREADGLARSSRNSYLTDGMRQAAPEIYAALSKATKAHGATSGSVRSSVRKSLEGMGMEVSYVSVADPREMDEKDDDAEIANSVVSVACLLKEGDEVCRLIDNVVVPAAGLAGP